MRADGGGGGDGGSEVRIELLTRQRVPELVPLKCVAPTPCALAFARS